MAVVTPLFKGHDDLPDLASRFVEVDDIPWKPTPCEGIEMKVLMEELATLYRTETDPEPELPALDVSYEDHVAAQAMLLEGARGEALRDFWRAELHDAPRVLELPTDRPRPERVTYEGNQVDFALDGEICGLCST